MKRLMHIVGNSMLAFMLVSASRVAAQGTGFTYQGRLNDGGGAASGSYDLRFAIYDAGSGGNLIAGPVTNSATGVTNGLFAVMLDFGPSVFSGPGRWLEIGVRTNSGSPGAFTILGQRQALTASPYAIFANAASNLSGTISSANLSGTYSSPVIFNNGANTFDGTFIGQFLGSTFTGGTFTGNFIGTGSGLMDVWHTGGNFGTTAGVNFLGTTDDEPLVIKVSNTEVMRYEPTVETPNIIGGWSGNYVQPNLTGVTIAGGGSPTFFAGKPQPNVVTNGGFYGTIGGGYNNAVTNYGGAILSGSVHLSGGNFAVIGGGQFNTNLGNYSFVGGGFQNEVQPNASYSVIAGGRQNTIDQVFYAAIGGGFQNVIESNATGAVIPGGYQNQILANASASVIGGGYFNVISSNNFEATIVGGYHNFIDATFGEPFIGGGYVNTVRTNAADAAIVGGDYNQVGGYTAFIGAGGWDGGAAAFGNTNNGNAAGIVAGLANNIQSGAVESFIGAGTNNVIETNAAWSVIGGGTGNSAGGGGSWVTVGGGESNQAGSGGSWGTVGGGAGNNASGAVSTIPGGQGNVAQGNTSFAAGTRAQALHDGAFVWADLTFADFPSTAPNQFLIRASGGVGINTNNPNGAALNVNGLVTASGFAGNGSSLMGVNATTVNGLSSSSFWSTTGNAGTTAGENFIGTTDNKPLLIKGNFVGINRTTPFTSAEAFGIDAPAGVANYGGMYVNMTIANGKPFYGYSVANDTVAAWSYMDGTDTNKWKLNIGSVDRITVTQNGLVGIGTTVPDATLSVNGTASKPLGGSWATFSDARLKKNIQPLRGALDRLMGLRAVTFEYKDPQSIHELPGVQIGMIAQEVEKVFPDWVDTAPNGMKRLSIHGFEALTVEALRELRAEKDAKISQLEKGQSELRKELAEARAELTAQKEIVNKVAARFDSLEHAMTRLGKSSSTEFAETQAPAEPK